MLTPVADQADLHSYKPAWGVDRYGYGTPLAGLVVFGDLTDVLGGQGEVACSHKIESVKILHQPDPNDPDLYGAITQESAYRVEVAAPDRKRLFCMSLMALDNRDRGRPSSWSSAVDSLTSGAADGQPRLMILSAGNTDSAQRRLYADSNFTDSIHDPAQAWNALTVGGYTDKYQIDAERWPQWQPVAPRGDLSPCSCTSVSGGKWPIKPDISMEAGNLAINEAVADPADLDDLRLLSTAACLCHAVATYHLWRYQRGSSPRVPLRCDRLGEISAIVA